jgi:CRISPR/Cas system-associated endoribonuclease Cas2
MECGDLAPLSQTRHVASIQSAVVPGALHGAAGHGHIAPDGLRQRSAFKAEINKAESRNIQRSEVGKHPTFNYDQGPRVSLWSAVTWHRFPRRDMSRRPKAPSCRAHSTGRGHDHIAPDGLRQRSAFKVEINKAESRNIQRSEVSFQKQKLRKQKAEIIKTRPQPTGQLMECGDLAPLSQTRHVAPTQSAVVPGALHGAGAW